MFLRLQNKDGSFPRKFKDDFSIVDKSGGSTPSATLPLVMGYKYFKDKRYLASAKHTVEYLEKELISKSDYFSSTLDANCEDKEASLYASTAAYYLALATKGAERAHYAGLARKAAYFALSWYYTWDVPFAPGQMLGDLGLKTRGWGNVSVENNHIDVFIFDFAVSHYIYKRHIVSPLLFDFTWIREISEFNFSDNFFLFNILFLPISCIPAVISVIPHNKVTAKRNGVWAEITRRHAICDKITSCFGCVSTSISDVNNAVFNIDCFTRHTDNSFNKKLAFVIRIVEYDYIISFRVFVNICKPACNYSVALLNSVYH